MCPSVPCTDFFSLFHACTYHDAMLPIICTCTIDRCRVPLPTMVNGHRSGGDAECGRWRLPQQHPSPSRAIFPASPPPSFFSSSSSSTTLPLLSLTRPQVTALESGQSLPGLQGHRLLLLAVLRRCAPLGLTLHFAWPGQTWNMALALDRPERGLHLRYGEGNDAATPPLQQVLAGQGSSAAGQQDSQHTDSGEEEYDSESEEEDGAEEEKVPIFERAWQLNDDDALIFGQSSKTTQDASGQSDHAREGTSFPRLASVQYASEGGARVRLSYGCEHTTDVPMLPRPAGEIPRRLKKSTRFVVFSMRLSKPHVKKQIASLIFEPWQVPFPFCQEWEENGTCSSPDCTLIVSGGGLAISWKAVSPSVMAHTLTHTARRLSALHDQPARDHRPPSEPDDRCQRQRGCRVCRSNGSVAHCVLALQQEAPGADGRERCGRPDPAGPCLESPGAFRSAADPLAAELRQVGHGHRARIPQHALAPAHAASAAIRASWRLRAAASCGAEEGRVAAGRQDDRSGSGGHWRCTSVGVCYCAV